MSKGQDSKKATKKKPAKTMKEKRKEKKEKKTNKIQLQFSGQKVLSPKKKQKKFIGKEVFKLKFSVDIKTKSIACYYLYPVTQFQHPCQQSY